MKLPSTTSDVRGRTVFFVDFRYRQAILAIVELEHAVGQIAQLPYGLVIPERRLSQLLNHALHTIARLFLTQA